MPLNHIEVLCLHWVNVSFCSASSILLEGSVGKTQLHDLTVCQAKLFLLSYVIYDRIRLKMIHNVPFKKYVQPPSPCPLSFSPSLPPSLTHTNFFHPHLECLHVSTAQGSPLCTSHQHKQKESHIKPSTTKTHEKKAWTQNNLSKFRWHGRKKEATSHQYKPALRIRPLTSHADIPSSLPTLPLYLLHQPTATSINAACNLCTQQRFVTIISLGHR